MVTRLKNIFLHPIFVVSAVVYSLMRYLRLSSYPLPGWINGYVTDLICMPVVLMICLAFVHVIKRDSSLRINLWLILLLCAEYAVLFEWILPQKSQIYTADWKDVILYFCGGLLFYFIQPLLLKEEKTNS